MLSQRYGYPLMRPLTVIAGLTIAAITLHEVSNWWEKAWATREDEMLSPDGCFRLETYKPYWILPSIFHPQPWHDGPATWGVIWGAPRFYRLYVAGTGIPVGETRTFDEHLGGEVTWGGYSFRKGGHSQDHRRRLSSGKNRTLHGSAITAINGRLLHQICRAPKEL